MREAATSMLVLGGILTLAVAMAIVGRLAARMPNARLGVEWFLVLGFIGCFVLGYLGYVGPFRPAHDGVTDLGVPIVFLPDGGFVLFVAYLMYRTSLDLRRISALEPEGLQGEQIPLSARMMNICDQYDALRSKRPYKPAFTHEKALEIITVGDVRHPAFPLRAGGAGGIQGLRWSVQGHLRGPSGGRLRPGGDQARFRIRARSHLLPARSRRRSSRD